MKKITICVCGSIVAYKSADIVNILKKKNYDLQVIMTKNATKFITPLTLETLSKSKVVTDMFEEPNYNYVGHIEYAQNTDLIVVVPTTANILGKFANGIADDMVSSTLIASNKPILMIPAMSSVMYENAIVQNNIKKLKEYGVIFLEPEVGMLACGVEGKGKIPKTSLIIEEIEKLLKEM